MTHFWQIGPPGTEIWCVRRNFWCQKRATWIRYPDSAEDGGAISLSQESGSHQGVYSLIQVRPMDPKIATYKFAVIPQNNFLILIQTWNQFYVWKRKFKFGWENSFYCKFGCLVFPGHKISPGSHLDFKSAWKSQMMKICFHMWWAHRESGGV